MPFAEYDWIEAMSCFIFPIKQKKYEKRHHYYMNGTMRKNKK